MTTAAPLAAARSLGSVYGSAVGESPSRARRARFPGAAVAPPSRPTSGSSQAASRPAFAGRDQQVPHVAASRSVPGTEPSLRRGQSSCALRGWEPHASQQAGRGGARRWTGRTLASERASVRSPSPEPAPLPAEPSRAEPSAAGFVRFVRAHLSGLPRRTPSRRVHAASHQVRGAGLGRWSGESRGQAAVGETRAVWRRHGDPFPGHCRRGCSLIKSLGTMLLTPHYEHSGATAFPRRFPSRTALSFLRSHFPKNSREVRCKTMVLLFAESMRGRDVLALPSPRSKHHLAQPCSLFLSSLPGTRPLVAG